MIGVEAGKLPVLCYMLDENLKVAIPSSIEFALPTVDMPAGNVLQKNDPGGGQLTILELLTPNVTLLPRDLGADNLRYVKSRLLYYQNVRTYGPR